jgi:Plasmid pRiA4b ORF-3-like protein
VTLRGTHPPIWRCIQVWEDATLAQLHRVLQMAMGWEDYHLHEFRMGRKIYGMPDLDDEREIMDVKQTRIHDVIQRVGTEFEYMYDFGDDWEHDLLLEAILLPDPDTSYPRCIGGERNGPREDVGDRAGMKTTWRRLRIPNTKSMRTCSRGVARSTRKHFRSPVSTSNSRRSSTLLA